MRDVAILAWLARPLLLPSCVPLFGLSQKAPAGVWRHYAKRGPIRFVGEAGTCSAAYLDFGIAALILQRGQAVAIIVHMYPGVNRRVWISFSVWA